MLPSLHNAPSIFSEGRQAYLHGVRGVDGAAKQTIKRGKEMNQNMLTAGKTIELAGKEIIVQELTVAQVRKIISTVDIDEVAKDIDDLLDANVPALAIADATGLTLAEMEEYRPSELASLAWEVEQANPFLVGLVERKVKAYNEFHALMMRTGSRSSETLTEPSAG